MIKLGCYTLFKLLGWKYVDHLQTTERSFVVVGAPHTSNWDFMHAMTVAYCLGTKASFVIKQDWLGLPFGPFLKSMGALGIDRKKIKSGEVGSSTDLMAHLFQEQTELVLLIAPEGTRSPVDEWKSGFWHVAHKAQVPIVLAYADYQKKELGLGLLIWPKDFEEDMRTIMDFYRSIQARFPEKFKLDRRYT